MAHFVEQLSIPHEDVLVVRLYDGNGDVAGQVFIAVGQPGSGGIDIRVERTNEAETGPVTVVTP